MFKTPTGGFGPGTVIEYRNGEVAYRGAFTDLVEVSIDEVDFFDVSSRRDFGITVDALYGALGLELDMALGSSVTAHLKLQQGRHEYISTVLPDDASELIESLSTKGVLDVATPQLFVIVATYATKEFDIEVVRSAQARALIDAAIAQGLQVDGAVGANEEGNEATVKLSRQYNSEKRVFFVAHPVVADRSLAGNLHRFRLDTDAPPLLFPAQLGG